MEIADNGEGILDASKERIFDMFYAENKTLADSRRSMGWAWHCAGLLWRPTAES